MPLRETEDAMIRGEAPPIHPPRPDPTPIGPETGAGQQSARAPLAPRAPMQRSAEAHPPLIRVSCRLVPPSLPAGDVLSIADFFEDEFVSEKDMSTFTPFLLRLVRSNRTQHGEHTATTRTPRLTRPPLPRPQAVESPNASALLGDLYCALLKAALVGPDDVEEKYNDTDSPPPPVWLKYLRRDGHSVWPELLRRWVVNGPCAAHYSKAELEMGAWGPFPQGRPPFSPKCAYRLCRRSHVSPSSATTFHSDEAVQRGPRGDQRPGPPHAAAPPLRRCSAHEPRPQGARTP